MSNQTSESKREGVCPSGSPQITNHHRLIELLAQIITRASQEQQLERNSA